jgi:uncharacterized membrane protein YqiK
MGMAGIGLAESLDLPELDGLRSQQEPGMKLNDLKKAAVKVAQALALATQRAAELESKAKAAREKSDQSWAEYKRSRKAAKQARKQAEAAEEQVCECRRECKKVQRRLTKAIKKEAKAQKQLAKKPAKAVSRPLRPNVSASALEIVHAPSEKSAVAAATKVPPPSAPVPAVPPAAGPTI